MVTETKAEMDAELEMDFMRELEIAKQHGLAMVKKVLIHWREKDQCGYRLINFSKETVEQLIKGEFKTFDELLNANLDQNRVVPILIRENFNSKKDDYDYYIETIFLDK
ncbi:MAG: hypothetical protein OIF50_00335 [Flavobacteriaceae bacterium]|nr:hypothetical protein [Flavobacteriaceae bacterium]